MVFELAQYVQSYKMQNNIAVMNRQTVCVCAVFYDFCNRKAGSVSCHLSDISKLVRRLHGSLTSKTVHISLLDQQNFLASAAYQETENVHEIYIDSECQCS